MKIRTEFIAAIAIVSLMIVMVLTDSYPINRLMAWGARMKSLQIQKINGVYDLYASPEIQHGDFFLLTDVKGGKHFWHPQVVIWIEDTAENYLETLFITKSAAKGLFFSGRTTKNHKSFNKPKDVKNFKRETLRNVDALPYWSHRRGIEVLPQFFAPTLDNPELDGITGATPTANFYVKNKLPKLNVFNIYLEVNVAFDENEHYSEYDFPEDSLYHMGTGLLGQPSLIYKATIDLNKEESTIMDLIGHAHPSGQSGNLYTNLSSITTAKEIINSIRVSKQQVLK